MGRYYGQYGAKEIGTKTKRKRPIPSQCIPYKKGKKGLQLRSWGERGGATCRGEWWDTKTHEAV